jgi:hypothetical protein
MSLRQSSLMKTPPVPAASPAPGHSGLLQRCACKNKSGGPDSESEEQKKKKKQEASSGPLLQRKSAQASAAAPASMEAPPIVHDVLRSPGQPLDAASRAVMEPRFGYDFSRVRVHTDARAAKSAEAVNAQAYAVGSNIVLGANQSGTGNSSNQRVLAHELAHVVQQDGRSAGGSLKVAPANDSAEGAADRAADEALSGGRVSNPTKASGRLQRLGANPACTPTQAKDLHQAVFNANSWVGKALKALAATPLAPKTLTALQHNFGAAGTAANAGTIAANLRAGQSDMTSDPISCTNAATDASCSAAGGAHCGDTPTAGGHAFNICTDVTLATNDANFRAGCVLHEAMHASNATMGAATDSYSGWFGHSSATAGYPGPNPMANADSYTTLAMELS